MRHKARGRYETALPRPKQASRGNETSSREKGKQAFSARKRHPTHGLWFHGRCCYTGADMKRSLALFGILALFLPCAFGQSDDDKLSGKLWRADDPRTANTINRYHADNPLNPANKYRGDNDYNPVNRFKRDNPLNPVNKYKSNNLLNPTNRFHPDSPLNFINRFRSPSNPPKD